MRTVPLENSLAPTRDRPTVWARVGRLIDGTSDAALKEAHLVYDAGTIRYAGQAPPPRGLIGDRQAPDADLPDYTALPGLIEAHAHLFLDGAPIDFEQRKTYLKRDHAWLLDRANRRWEKLLQCGVTAIRDAGDKDGVGLALAKAYSHHAAENRGLSRTPYIDSPGSAIHHAGRYGRFMGEPIEDHADAEACVAARVAAGAYRIKLLATGIINFEAGAVTTPPQMSVEAVRAIVDAAELHGKQTFAHASGAQGVGNAIEGGVTTVEHGFFVADDQLRRMRDTGTGWVPTFAPVQLQIDRADVMGWPADVVDNLRRIIDEHNRALRLGHELGVTIIAGSDAGSCGVSHGLGFLRELELMEAAGMPALAVINSATGVSAGALGFAEPMGRLVEGCKARIILTRHDPTQSVRHLAKEKVVVFDGRVIRSPERIDPEGM